jgi:hypothetical protein
MALAWKAGWVQALTSSNLVSSATANCALTRAYALDGAPAGNSATLSVRYLCEIARGPWPLMPQDAGPGRAFDTQSGAPRCGIYSASPPGGGAPS